MKRRRPGKKVVIGITGGFGSGKTTAARAFAALGASVVDADAIARRLLQRGTATSRRVIRVFGSPVRAPAGGIDRRRLAAIVFQRPAALKKLEAIVHPAIIRCMREEIRRSKNKFVVIDAPLLLEKKLDRLCDSVVVVTASRSNQTRRVRERDALSRDQVLSRIKAQMPLSKKVRLADFIIDNDGTRAAVRKQAAQIRRKLWKS
ncbi:MAG: dephospho-CoA kinase [Candidatus Omnitrophica bacterium]|nr:dephospho-CoA kinase [Candidatus Omnitrophota bacterium]